MKIRLPFFDGLFVFQRKSRQKETNPRTDSGVSRTVIYLNFRFRAASDFFLRFTEGFS